LARILCVDDDAAVVSLRKRLLEQAGYSVTACGSVEEALLELENVHYDAVITDWRLQDDSGRKVVLAAKSQSSVPVVVVSGYVGEAFQAAEPLADIYLEKPADSRELLQILKILLEVRASKARDPFS
jgi:DNA-binding response OmpR family regulator